MSDRSQILLSAAFVASLIIPALVAVDAVIYFGTKPNCPKWADPQWTLSGWLCTVRPLSANGATAFQESKR